MYNKPMKKITLVLSGEGALGLGLFDSQV